MLSPVATPVAFRAVVGLAVDFAAFIVARCIIVARAWRLLIGIASLCVAIAFITSWPWALLAFGILVLVYDQFNPRVPPQPRPSATEQRAMRDGRI